MKRHSLLGEEPRELNLEQQFQAELRDHEGDTVAGVSIIDRNPLMRWLQFMFAAGGAACELVDAIPAKRAHGWLPVRIYWDFVKLAGKLGHKCATAFRSVNGVRMSADVDDRRIVDTLFWAMERAGVVPHVDSLGKYVSYKARMVRELSFLKNEKGFPLRDLNGKLRVRVCAVSTEIAHLEDPEGNLVEYILTPEGEDGLGGKTQPSLESTLVRQNGSAMLAWLYVTVKEHGFESVIRRFEDYALELDAYRPSHSHLRVDGDLKVLMGDAVTGYTYPVSDDMYSRGLRGYEVDPGRLSVESVDSQIAYDEAVWDEELEEEVEEQPAYDYALDSCMEAPDDEYRVNLDPTLKVVWSEPQGERQPTWLQRLPFEYRWKVGRLLSWLLTTMRENGASYASTVVRDVVAPTTDSLLRLIPEFVRVQTKADGSPWKQTEKAIKSHLESFGEMFDKSSIIRQVIYDHVECVRDLWKIDRGLIIRSRPRLATNKETKHKFLARMVEFDLDREMAIAQANGRQVAQVFKACRDLEVVHAYEAYRLIDEARDRGELDPRECTLAWATFHHFQEDAFEAAASSHACKKAEREVRRAMLHKEYSDGLVESVESGANGRPF